MNEVRHLSPQGQPVGPFAGEVPYRAWLTEAARSEDPLFHAIVEVGSGQAVGLAAYLRIDPVNGVIEAGHLQFSPRLRRTPAATDAMYLMMRRAFEFRFEGIFRQAIVSKGRTRDTAWFSIADAEWPDVKAAFERWLAPENFDVTGRQRRKLSALRATET